MRRFILAAAALAAAALIPVLAFASAPKTGYYYAAVKQGGLTIGQMFAQVNSKPEIVSFSGTCPAKSQGGVNYTYQVPGHIPVNGSSFKFKGKVKVADTGSGHKEKAKITGKFTKGGKHWKGKAVVKSCKDVKFKGDFIGRHPGG